MEIITLAEFVARYHESAAELARDLSVTRQYINGLIARDACVLITETESNKKICHLCFHQPDAVVVDGQVYQLSREVGSHE